MSVVACVPVSLHRANHRVGKSCDPGDPGLGNALGIWGTFLPKNYTVLLNFEICHNLCTFETIFRLNVGNILDYWDRLRIIYLFFIAFWVVFFPYFLSGSDWGTFFMISVQQN